MKMKLGLEEDTNIEVPEEGDPIEEAAETQSENEAVEEASEEVEEVAAMGFNICEVIDNLTSLRAHVKKFGVTKQMLHLVNANNQLGNAIGITLPYYESDDEADDIDESDIPSEEVVMEGFADGIKKAKDAVVKFFKMIWDKLVSWYKAVFDQATRLEKKMKSVYSVAFNQNIDTKAFEATEVAVISGSLWEKKRVAIKAALDKIGDVKISSGDSIIDVSTLNAGLIYAGKKIALNGDTYSIEKTEYKDEKTKKELGKNGWGFSEFKANFGKMLKISNDIKEAEKAKAALKKLEAEALKGIKAQGKDEKEAKKAGKKALTSAASSVLSAINSLVSEYMKLGFILVALSNKAKETKDSKK